MSSSVGSIGPLKNTMRPRARSPSVSTSAKECTSTTPAVIPPGGVAMLLPMARIFSGVDPNRREMTRPSSIGPRTQCCTIVGSVRTASKPSAFMWLAIVATAASACEEPVGRGPAESTVASVA